MNNNNRPSEADKDRYFQIVKWAAERGMAITMHWGNDASVDHLLTIFERVHAAKCSETSPSFSHSPAFA